MLIISHSKFAEDDLSEIVLADVILQIFRSRKNFLEQTSIYSVFLIDEFRN